MTDAMAAQVGAAQLYPILLARVVCVSGDVLVWSGLGDLTWAGKTWLGVGTLGGVSGVAETTETAAKGVTLSLSGIPSDMIETALAETRQGLPAEVWFGCLDAEGALIGDPFLLFRGLTDVPTIEEGAETCTISITAESRLIDLERARTRRYTPEDQHLDYPGDKGFDFVVGLQNREFKFGRA
jgi:hypothetical protein